MCGPRFARLVTPCYVLPRGQVLICPVIAESASISDRSDCLTIRLVEQVVEQSLIKDKYQQFVFRSSVDELSLHLRFGLLSVPELGCGHQAAELRARGGEERVTASFKVAA